MVIYHGEIFGQKVKIHAMNGVKHIVKTSNNQLIESHDYWKEELDRQINRAYIHGERKIVLTDMWNKVIAKVWL